MGWRISHFHLSLRGSEVATEVVVRCWAQRSSAGEKKVKTLLVKKVVLEVLGKEMCGQASAGEEVKRAEVKRRIATCWG